MERAGIVIAAPKSGSGKTLITCALIQALRNRKKQVHSFKCGPDYIDPMFHRSILEIPGGNLDTFFTGEEQTKELFVSQTSREEFCVVEGVMGLFDGIGGTKEEGSTYHLAHTLNLPVILVIDAHGMGRSLLPMIGGFLSYDHCHLIRGVILNRISASYYPVLAKLIRQEFQIEVLGYFPQVKELHLESRHLGLKMPQEIQDLKKQVGKAAELLEKSVQVDRILALGSQNTLQIEMESRKECTTAEETKPVLAVAKDEAFCFYYQENLAILKKAGFSIREFSPIHDHELPQGTCAILLGGGYPELYAKELAENLPMKQAVKAAIETGMPSVAECGGFLYLHKELTDEKGNTYKMAGVIDANCFYTGKLVRFGYVNVEEKESHFLEKEGVICGHEFHYYDSTDNGSDCTAKKPDTDRNWNCVMDKDTHWWGFVHLYYPSNPSFVAHFEKKARDYLLTLR